MHNLPLPSSEFCAVDSAAGPHRSSPSRRGLTIRFGSSRALRFVAAALFVSVAASPIMAVPFSFSPTGSMNQARLWHTSTLLRTGKVLVAGGGVAGEIGTAELYDPATGTWTTTGSLNIPRAFHTATLLPSGKVLVVGGLANSGGAQRTVELYDPATGTWSLTGQLGKARQYHTATLLPNGKVLVAGGEYQSSAELYDPAAGTWTPTGSMARGRDAHTATLLPNGKVLVAGGRAVGSLAEAELFDPATGNWAATGSMATARATHTATLLPDGKVLVAAGFDYNTGQPRGTAEIYNPATGTWSPTGSLAAARNLHTATLLPDGKVLVAGGAASNGKPVATAELFNPATGTWSAAGSMAEARVVHTADLLPTNKVLVAGGDGIDAHELATAELYITSGPITTLRNISTRLPVETGDNVLIAGFIIEGSAPKKVIIRAIGPSLTAKGVSGALADPTLELNKPDGTVFNDNWRENAAAIAATTIPPERDEESAIVETLAPGAYTTVVRGKDATSGVGVVEVYDLDAAAGSSLANISTRGRVQAGDNVIIGGFIVGGSTNVTQVLVRGLGPSLADEGLASVLANPTLDLRNGDGERLIANDDWQDDPPSAERVTAYALAPKRAEEAAIFTTLPPGNYTAILAGKDGATGIGLLEFYNIR